MRKRFMLIRDTKFAVFKIEICGTLLKHYLHENEVLHTPTFYMKMNHVNIVFTNGNVFST